MSRFVIEDIISQDKRGIVFSAHDTEKGHTVALRRFFPFGQEGGGLSAEEALAFKIAAQRLEGVRHDSLRSVIAGSVDSIDGMPFIVAEWIDGAPLDGILDGGTLEASHIVNLLQLALEVSLLLSEALGEEAVWVETEADSIFVGSEESGRGFVYWLSPFKWLGAEFGSRKLASLVELGERLAGGRGKLSGNKEGADLGAWLKWMRANPDAGLAQALAAYTTQETEGESPPQLPARPAASHPALKVKPPSSVAPWMIAACAALLMAVGALVYLHRTAKAPVIPPQYAEQKISPPVVEAPPNLVPAIPRQTAAENPLESEPHPAPVVNTPESKSAPAIGPDEEAMSAAKVNELAEKLAREAELKRMAARVPTGSPSPSAPLAPPQRNFTPLEASKMKSLKANGPATLTGVVRNVRLSRTGKSLYFEFSSPINREEISVVAPKGNYQGEFTPQSYADLRGKMVQFEGVVYREPNGRQFVKISSRKKLKVVE